MGSSSEKRRLCAILLPSMASLLLLGCAGTPQTNSFQFLHTITTQVESDFDPNRPLAVAVTVAKPSELIAVLAPESIVDTSGSEIVVRLFPYPVLREKERPLHLQSTFLVDFESEAVRALLAARSTEIRPTPSELVAWTRETIEPAWDRGFDSASIIAANGRGDCTEYAVLFGALARSAGYPTRIAIGVVIAESEGEVQAFGHAWAEVLLDNTWTLVDPTPIEGAHAIGHLPEGYLRDEGPGYGLDLMRLQAIEVSKVRVLNNE